MAKSDFLVQIKTRRSLTSDSPKGKKNVMFVRLSTNSFHCEEKC